MFGQTFKSYVSSSFFFFNSGIRCSSLFSARKMCGQGQYAWLRELERFWILYTTFVHDLPLQENLWILFIQQVSKHLTNFIVKTLQDDLFCSKYAKPTRLNHSKGNKWLNWLSPPMSTSRHQRNISVVALTFEIIHVREIIYCVWSFKWTERLSLKNYVAI